MKCPICNQSFMSGLAPEHCPACGYPLKKLMDIIGGNGEIRTKTHVKAIAFYKNFVRQGGWFELKKIGHKNYLYGRLRVGKVKQSQYIGKI